MSQTRPEQCPNLVGCEIELPLLPDNLEGYLDQRESIWKQMRDTLNGQWSLDRDVYTEKITGMTNQGDERHPGIGHDASTLLLEFSLPPCESLGELEREWLRQYQPIRDVLRKNAVALLGTGMQPDLDAGVEDAYETWRTPRGYYNLLVEKRKWEHRWLMNTASIQPSIDVPKDGAIEYINLFEKMSALLQPLSANASVQTWDTVEDIAELRGQRNWEKVLRRSADANLQTSGMPRKPYENLNEYMEYIFSIPLFYIVQKGQTGINKKAKHLLPASLDDTGRPPSLKQLLVELVEKGRTISASNLYGEECTLGQDDISPMTLAQIDWYSFRPARLRYVLNPMDNLQNLWQTYQSNPSDLMKKTYVEIRNMATQLPGEEMMPCALFTGITRGYQELVTWAEQFSWEELRAFDKQYGDRFTAWQQKIAGRPYAEISGEMLEIIAKNLLPEEQRYLDGIRERQESLISPASLTKAALLQGKRQLLSLISHRAE